jgi:hypothetical protein
MTTLIIDGKALEYDLAGTMYQSSPYPGGHTYSLDIDVDPELFDFLQAEKEYEPVSEDLAETVLSRLTRMLRGNSQRQCQYYLNSIQSLSVGKNYRLYMKGVCSDVI